MDVLHTDMSAYHRLAQVRRRDQQLAILRGYGAIEAYGDSGTY